MIGLKTGLAAALLTVAVGVSAQKAPHYPIQKFQLPNGMHVVFSEDHSAPVIGLALAYDVGSRNEIKGRSGFAHLFEHLMFEGSGHVAKGEFDKYIASSGGSANAFTRAEDTTYHETFPAEKLPLMLWMEADRMRSLAVTAENLKNQQEVVKEEKRLRFDNQPYTTSRQRVNELAFSNYSNSHTVIGLMEDLDAASLSYVQGFFKMYYAPNNATLVLVGDFDPRTARPLITRLFADVPRQPAPPTPDLTESPQTAEKRDVVTDPLARLPGLALAWHGPSIDNPDAYAMDMLAQIVFAGETSRAYQQIVKGKQLALNLNGGLNAQRGPSLFSVFALYRPGIPTADLEQAIYAQIEAVKQTPPSVEELQRAKTRLRASQYSGLESFMGRALQIVDYAVLEGDANLINTEISRYMAVTPEQIQAVARKYFTPQNRVVVEIQPTMPTGRGGAR